jgi:hypothetical protein
MEEAVAPGLKGDSTSREAQVLSVIAKWSESDEAGPIAKGAEVRVHVDGVRIFPNRGEAGLRSETDCQILTIGGRW